MEAGSAAFINARIFDGEAPRLVDGQNVFVRDGLILEVSDRPPTPDDGTAIDCDGRTLMPGLIDCHVHAYALSPILSEVANAPDTLAATWATGMLSRMLDRGFTTVRDTGGADYGLFLGLTRGYIRGPRLFYCGRAISQTGGHADLRNPHHKGCSDVIACGCGQAGLFSAVVDGVDAVRKVVRENLFRGSNFIKFMGSGGVSSTGDKLESLQFSDEEVVAIVEEVERHGAYCTAHIHPDKALSRAIRLGVHCIEHGTLIEPETARLAADRGTYIVPTMSIIWSLDREGRELGFPEQSLEKLKLIKDEAVGRLQHMKDAGVKVGYGTDLLGPLERHQLQEFKLRGQIYSNHEMLVQATSMAAEIVGAKGKLGIVRAGAAADLLVVDGDPLEDIDCLVADGANLRIIMKEGAFVKNELGAPPR
jgi:imidazolonepropionase-like amidohydrolase